LKEENGMGIEIRRSKDRGLAEHGWLKSYHTFSFADYYDPAQMGFRSLRVINEDYVAGGMGFGAHPHKDMEIITYVLEGVLAHKDSIGNQENINAGDFQKMSAGTGVTHSEFNADPKKTVHFFQIWIQPNKRGIAPVYQQTTIEKSFKDGLLLVASDTGREKTIFLQQDAQVFVGRFKSGMIHSYNIKSGRGVWLQMIKGHITINDQELNDSDAAAVENEAILKIKMLKDSEFLLFDLI
jgi:redox-sensitive bicupin YhaK (pirin superfamily)